MNQKQSKNIYVYYFGADMPWKELVVHGFRRRNTCFLQSLVNNDDVSKVFVVRQSTRAGIIKNILNSKKVNHKVVDVFITTLLPERSWLPLSKQINKLVTSFLFLVQTGRLVKSTDIIWIYWVAAYLFAKRLNMEGRYIFDVDHNIIGDDNLPVTEKDRVAKILVDIAHKSEFILSSSRSMIRWFESRGFTNCVTSRNGIDPSRFTKSYPIPDDISKISSPRILYVGTLSKWMNTELLISLIKKHPEWNFIFIGGNYKTGISAELEAIPNVTMLGFKLAEEVPAYMKNVDVALGMYRNIDWLDVDSMKFYEYLAANVPVVTTNYHPNIKSDFNKLIKVSNDINEIEEMINAVLSESDKMKADWNKKALDFVDSNTWDSRIADVIEIL